MIIAGSVEVPVPEDGMWWPAASRQLFTAGVRLSRAHPVVYAEIEENIAALRAAARSTHPDGGVQTAHPCVCGAGMGGPAGSPLCRVLEDYLARVGHD